MADLLDERTGGGSVRGSAVAESARWVVSEGVARGQEIRSRLPRSQHGRWVPGATRRDPVTLLVEQGRTRVRELLPIRYGRMLASPFAFYRGAAVIMASDLSTRPHTGLQAQLCGDAHLGNFGVLAVPERQLLFDMNDFDETLPGPWEWDVKRLAASCEIAGRDRGFGAADRRSIVSAAVREYREQMRRSAELGTLDVWRAQVAAPEITMLVRAEVMRRRLSEKEGRDILATFERARTSDNAPAFVKRARVQDGEPVFIPQPPMIVPVEDLWPPGQSRERNEQSMRRLLAAYRRTLAQEHHPIDGFRCLRMARKIGAVGSTGTRCWIMVMAGRDRGDPLILQAKEAQASVLEWFLGPSRFANHGQRVVVGQYLMQAAGDIFVGWVRVPDADGELRDYYVRQFHDCRAALDIEAMSPAGAVLYAELCGAALARAHARSGDRVAIAAYLGRSDAFDHAMTGFAAAYADQNERDYEAFRTAVAAGRVEAVSIS